MKGDFSRVTFDAKNHFSQVLLQQGRVTLDADPNEQSAILLHYLRCLAADLIGPCGGPADYLGFQLILSGSAGDPSPPALKFSAGRYYVEGILAENDTEIDYAHQADLAIDVNQDPVLKLLADKNSPEVFIYLDVWERHITWIEQTSIRESALGGPDTCTRRKVVWQARAIELPKLLVRVQAKIDRITAKLGLLPAADPRVATLIRQRDRLNADYGALSTPAKRYDCKAPLQGLADLSDAQMMARLDPGPQIKDPCVLAPDTLYRGVENHLYRVEVHRGSKLDGSGATFKWSRDNGSIVASWIGVEGNDLIVSSGHGFKGGWVELTDDTDDLSGRPGALVKVSKVEGTRLSVDADWLAAGGSFGSLQHRKNPKVRAWDQTEADDLELTDGAIDIDIWAKAAKWIDLEDGVQVMFSKEGDYRSGDYWLITARVATGGIDWPTDPEKKTPTWQAPRGIEHHYASLGHIVLKDGALEPEQCGCKIEVSGDCPQLSAAGPQIVTPESGHGLIRRKAPARRPPK